MPHVWQDVAEAPFPESTCAGSHEAALGGKSVGAGKIEKKLPFGTTINRSL
jgi:hypothetical protein